MRPSSKDRFDGFSYNSTWLVLRLHVDQDQIPFATKIFPNPSRKGRFSLLGNLKYNNEEVRIGVYGMNGHVIYIESFEPQSFRLEKEFDLDLKAGLYLMQIQQGSFVQSAKILIK